MMHFTTTIKNKSTKILYIAYFFFSWAIGFTVYSNSSVLEIINGTKSVGIIYGLAALATLIFSTWVTPFAIKHYGNKRFGQITVLIQALSILSIILVTNPVIFGFCFIIFLATQVLLNASFDLFFEHNTLKEDSASVRGSIISLQHIGRMLGPILAAFITTQFGLKIPYLFSLVLIITTGILLYISTKNFKDKKYDRISIFTVLKKIKDRPAIKKSLVSLVLLQIFYALMVTFVPIYLHEVKGIPIEKLGILFTIMLLPFVLLSPKIGRQIDTGVSGRIMAKYGLCIMAITTIIFPFVETTSLVVWGGILLISRIGAVLLETSAEGIFFRSVNEEETELLGIMRDMQPIGYFVASFISIVTLLFGDIKDIFYVVGAILIIGILFTSKRIKNAHK